MGPSVFRLKCTLIVAVVFVVCLAPEVNAAVASDSIVQKVSLTSRDAVSLNGFYYPAMRRGSPGLILLHMWSRSKEDWADFAKTAWRLGYGVLAIDLRGHGESITRKNKPYLYRTFKNEDYKNMAKDIQACWDFVSKAENIDAGKIAVMGASLGANVGMTFAAAQKDVAAVVLLSPGLDYHGVRAAAAVVEYGQRPVLIAASSSDAEGNQAAQLLDGMARGDKTIRIFPGKAHGTQMLGESPELVGIVFNWLDEKLNLQEAPQGGEFKP